jgi:diguanylate cyclase
VAAPALSKAGRRQVITASKLTVVVLTAAIVISQLAQVGRVAGDPAFWLMTGLAALAGTQAFIASRPLVGSPVIICPTICFTFAILLCWGLGPAIVAQFVAVVVVAWRLRRPVAEAVAASVQYTLSFTAAALVLWMSKPDTLHHRGVDIAEVALYVVGAIAAWLTVYGFLAVLAERSLPIIPRLRRNGRKSDRKTDSTIGNQMLFKAALLVLSPILAITAHINIGFVPLVLIPLYAVQRMAKLSAERDLAARRDPLTGLANRSGLRADFALLASTCAAARQPTLLIADLDEFKHVNDALGHDVGDQLLIAVARRLSALPTEIATIARLGGDEFAILATTCDAIEADDLARSVVQALSEPVTLGGLRVDVTASVGIAVHAEEEDFGTLMRHADIAMYEAKQRGDMIAAYESGADEASPERLALLTDFRQALESHDGSQITMHYQPQVEVATNKVEGVEALLRWRHPVHGPIDTQDLITMAEHSSVMHLLTMRVIDDVIAQVAAWSADGITLRASINVSSRDLYSNEIVTHLADQLSHHDVDPSQIQIEITESALLKDPSRAMGTVARLCALGVAVALDDFGTGYSSLQHLRKLPITEIKIDRSFVAGMANNRDDAAIVRSTVEMARSLGIRTVAEGVETEYTRALLADIGCTLVQGWLTAHPMPASEVGRWLTRSAPRSLPRSLPRSQPRSLPHEPETLSDLGGHP